MAGNPQILVEYRSDTSGLAKGLKGAERGVSRFGSTIKRLGKVGAVAAGAAGVGALVATMKIGIDEFTEAAKVTAQTEAVIKSTGKAAGVTAKQVADLSEAIMEKTGIDDEAIQSGQNMLLTFTNVRNEVGKGNDIFNQADRDDGRHVGRAGPGHADVGDAARQSPERPDPRHDRAAAASASRSPRRRRSRSRRWSSRAT